MYDTTHIIEWNVIQVELEGEFQTEPFCILDKRERMLRNRAIFQMQVQWKNFSPRQATLEMKDKMREAYPSVFWNEKGSTK